MDLLLPDTKTLPRMGEFFVYRQGKTNLFRVSAVSLIVDVSARGDEITVQAFSRSEDHQLFRLLSRSLAGGMGTSNSVILGALASGLSPGTHYPFG